MLEFNPLAALSGDGDPASLDPSWSLTGILENFMTPARFSVWLNLLRLGWVTLSTHLQLLALVWNFPLVDPSLGAAFYLPQPTQSQYQLHSSFLLI
ncbi:hypothetical protein O181_006841 [Austropuccinia psidii MF-1]|uniref:Uncharacterized protein n=1 Tax=Austropuccinia psidii MF-1 TaxID=1389203 RepID=A0A9Q3GH39_9BASI|nr:hypothetical protein [Austropuccinia psidii MF-1]